jgi:hypothetical protein
MGSITRSIANNITTNGVFTSSAIDNTSVTGITVLANAPADGITLISSQTASASASISFTTGIDSTYKAYKFVFVNIHPASAQEFRFNLSTDGGSNYNVTKTSTFFVAFHYENDSSTTLGYGTAADLAQSTAFQTIASQISTANSKSASGSLHLFNPSSTTFVKHFISNANVGATDGGGDLRSVENFVAGYGNTTSAINAIRFQMASGNIDAGTIYMYGIK